MNLNRGQYKPRDLVAVVSESLGLQAPARTKPLPRKHKQQRRASSSSVQLSMLEAHAVRVVMSYQIMSRYEEFRHALVMGTGASRFRFTTIAAGREVNRLVELPHVSMVVTSLLNDAANVLAALSTVRGRINNSTVPPAIALVRWNQAVSNGVLTPALVYIIDKYLNEAQAAAPILTALGDQIKAVFTRVPTEQRPSFIRALTKMALYNTVALPNRLSLVLRFIPSINSPLIPVLTHQGVKWERNPSEVIISQNGTVLARLPLRYDLARYLSGMPVVLTPGQTPLPVADESTMRL
jgi:hypothetical protein